MRSQQKSFSVTLLGAALMIGLMPLARGAFALEAHVSQLDFLNEDGTVRIANSKVGEIAFDFDGSEFEFLARNGGAYVNVVVASATPTGIPGHLVFPVWAVQNLYLSFPTQWYMANADPSVHFPLPAQGDVGQIILGYSVSKGPAPQFPLVAANLAAVSDKKVHFGGRDGGGSGLSDLHLHVQNWIGPGSRPKESVWTWL